MTLAIFANRTDKIKEKRENDSRFWSQRRGNVFVAMATGVRAVILASATVLTLLHNCISQSLLVDDNAWAMLLVS